MIGLGVFMRFACFVLFSLVWWVLDFVMMVLFGCNGGFGWVDLFVF